MSRERLPRTTIITLHLLCWRLTIHIHRRPDRTTVITLYLFGWCLAIHILDVEWWRVSPEKSMTIHAPVAQRIEQLSSKQ